MTSFLDAFNQFNSIYKAINGHNINLANTYDFLILNELNTNSHQDLLINYIKATKSQADATFNKYCDNVLSIIEKLPKNHTNPIKLPLFNSKSVKISAPLTFLEKLKLRNVEVIKDNSVKKTTDSLPTLNIDDINGKEKRIRGAYIEQSGLSCYFRTALHMLYKLFDDADLFRSAGAFIRNIPVNLNNLDKLGCTRVIYEILKYMHTKRGQDIQFDEVIKTDIINKKFSELYELIAKVYFINPRDPNEYLKFQDSNEVITHVLDSFKIPKSDQNYKGSISELLNIDTKEELYFDKTQNWYNRQFVPDKKEYVSTRLLTDKEVDDKYIDIMQHPEKYVKEKTNDISSLLFKIEKHNEIGKDETEHKETLENIIFPYLSGYEMVDANHEAGSKEDAIRASQNKGKIKIHTNTPTGNYLFINIARQIYDRDPIDVKKIINIQGTLYEVLAVSYNIPENHWYSYIKYDKWYKYDYSCDESPGFEVEGVLSKNDNSALICGVLLKRIQNKDEKEYKSGDDENKSTYCVEETLIPAIIAGTSICNGYSIIAIILLIIILYKTYKIYKYYTSVQCIKNEKKFYLNNNHNYDIAYINGIKGGN